MHWAKVKSNVVDLRINKDFTYYTPLVAAEITISNIIKNHPPPYNLLVSGGIDSQAMLYCWYLFGKNYIPLTFSYNTDFNWHDIENIITFSKKFNLSLDIRNIDVIKFVTEEYDKFSEPYRCSSPCISTHIKMIESLKGTKIFSGNFIEKNMFSDAVLGLYRASLIQKNVIPFFFLYSSELGYSLKNDIQSPEFYKLKEYDQKVYLYHKYEFPVIPQVEKITGFEKIKDYFDVHFAHNVLPIKKIQYAGKPSKRTFDLLYRYPYEKKYNDQKIVTLITQ